MTTFSKIGKFLEESTLKRNLIDLGCGEGELAEQFAVDLKHKKFRVLKDIRSFDLVAIKPHIEVCDISLLPIESSSVDVAVFCLSLMGTNYSQFLKEAFRVLKIGGFLIISEILSRFSNVKNFCSVINNFGAEQVYIEEINSYFNLLMFKKTENRRLDTVNQKVDWLALLKPCLYKKR